jgi:hypothetical protein
MPPLIQKGWFALPKEVILKKLCDNKIVLVQTSNSERGDIYYNCLDPNCKYKLKIIEVKEKKGTLSTAAIIHNFKSFEFLK